MRVFGHSLTPGALPAMVMDMALCFLAVLLAASSLTTRYGMIQGAVPELPLILVGATIFSVVMALMYAIAGLYRPISIPLMSAIGRTVFCLLVGGYLTSLSLRIVADRGYVEQLLPAAIAYLAVGLVFVHCGLFFMRRVRTHPRVLIVGTGAEASALASDLASSRRAPRDVVGLYPASTDERGSSRTETGQRIFSREQSISELVSRYRVHEIIVAVREQRGGGVPMDELLACRIRGIPVLDLAAYSEKTRCEVPIDSLKGSWLVYGHGFVQGHARRVLKRIFDVVCSIVLLVLLSPLVLLAMIAIKLESPGPVIYRQERVGLGGRSFMCLKLRSMRNDAEKDGVARWASKNDPRVTRVGSFMRKTRIDELPQLWSVLIGEMSLVGPRPERPGFVEELKQEIPFYEIRHTVKPGVTGWAQVRYHYGATMEDARRKHQFDLYYVKNNSLILDLLVLIETVSVIVFREGQ